MKRFIILIIINSFIIPTTTAKEKSRYFKLGTTISDFRNTDTEPRGGFVGGVGWCYNITNYSHLNGYFNFELLYTNKKCDIKNKTWPTNPEIRDVVIGDVCVNIGYLEVPIKFGCYLNLKNNIKLMLFIGAIPSIGLKNLSKTKHKKYILLEPEERDQYNFDYERKELDDSNVSLPLSLLNHIDKSAISMNIGTKIKWVKFYIEFSYSKAISETKDMVSLTLHDKIDTYYASFGIYF